MQITIITFRHHGIDEQYVAAVKGCHMTFDEKEKMAKVFKCDYERDAGRWSNVTEEMEEHPLFKLSDMRELLFCETDLVDTKVMSLERIDFLSVDSVI